MNVTGADAAIFSLNSKDECLVFNGTGIIMTELVFMYPVIMMCEACGGIRYSEEALP